MNASVMYVTRVFAPYRRDFCDEMASRGWDISVVVAGWTDGEASRQGLNGLAAKSTVLNPKGIGWRSDLLKTIKDNKPSILLLEHGARLDFTWTALLATTRKGPARVIWTHGIERVQKYSRARSIGAIGHAVQLRMAEGIVCYDRQSAEQLARSFPRKVIGCAANSTDGCLLLEARRQMAAGGKEGLRAELGLKCRYYIVGLGRQIPKKAFHRLPLIVRRLRDEGLDAGLLFIGDGPERGRIEVEARRLGLSDESAAVFAGAVTERAKLSRWLLAADVSVSAGSFGLSAVDSLFAGLPVIGFAPSASGPYHGPEWVHIRHGVTGWIAPSNDEAALASLVREYLLQPESARRQMEDACRDYAEHHLGIKRMVSGMETVLEKVLIRRRPIL